MLAKTTRPRRPAIVHRRDLRLRNNAGIDFPECYASATLLDMDKTGLPTTGNPNAVTCKRCKRSRRYSR